MRPYGTISHTETERSCSVSCWGRYLDIKNLATLSAGSNCWRLERATCATVIIDAADYFRFVRAAGLKARQRIILVGWDFDARI